MVRVERLTRPRSPRRWPAPPHSGPRLWRSTCLEVEAFPWKPLAVADPPSLCRRCDRLDPPVAAAAVSCRRTQARPTGTDLVYRFGAVQDQLCPARLPEVAQRDTRDQLTTGAVRHHLIRWLGDHEPDNGDLPRRRSETGCRPHPYLSPGTGGGAAAWAADGRTHRHSRDSGLPSSEASAVRTMPTASLVTSSV